MGRLRTASCLPGAPRSIPEYDGTDDEDSPNGAQGIVAVGEGRPDCDRRADRYEPASYTGETDGAIQWRV